MGLSESVAMNQIGAGPKKAIQRILLGIVEVPPKINVNLVFGPSITLFHRILMRRLKLTDQYAASEGLTRAEKTAWLFRDVFTEEDRGDWERLREYALRDRGPRSAADHILSWMNDLGVSYSQRTSLGEWRYFPTLKFTWE